jgi:hypothetical protein
LDILHKLLAFSQHQNCISKFSERAMKLQVGSSATKYSERHCHDLQNSAAEIASATEDFNIVDSVAGSGLQLWDLETGRALAEMRSALRAAGLGKRACSLLT